MTPQIYSAFVSELEKIAISGELAGKALASRVATINHAPLGMVGSEALHARTARQAGNIGNMFNNRAVAQQRALGNSSHLGGGRIRQMAMQSNTANADAMGFAAKRDALEMGPAALRARSW